MRSECHSFVITTGHMSGGHLDESLWMSQHPSIMRNAKTAIVCEHFGAIEWKDDHSGPRPVYKPTGNLEPMWTMAYVLSSLTQLLFTLDPFSMAETIPRRAHYCISYIWMRFKAHLSH